MTGPDLMSGNDGEVVFIRHDLAATETAARAYALEHDGQGLAGCVVDVIDMLPIPEHFINIDAEWWIVKPDTPDAVRYWRFQY